MVHDARCMLGMRSVLHGNVCAVCHVCVAGCTDVGRTYVQELSGCAALPLRTEARSRLDSPAGRTAPFPHSAARRDPNRRRALIGVCRVLLHRAPQRMRCCRLGCAAR